MVEVTRVVRACPTLSAVVLRAGARAGARLGAWPFGPEGLRKSATEATHASE